jgi:hypothetical protein
MEDILARTKMNNIVVNMSSEGAAELTKLDEEVIVSLPVSSLCH